MTSLPEIDRSALAAHAAPLAALGRRLLDGGLTPERLRAALGVPDFFSILDAASAPEPDVAAAAPLLVRLFLLGHDVPAGEATALLGDGTDLLLALGLLSRTGDTLRAEIGLAPMGRPGLEPVLVAFERLDAMTGEWAVAAPDSATDLLCHASRRGGGGGWLDVGAGSGAIALVAARQGAAPVVAADLNPRAAACVDLGAALSGLAGRVEAVTSDLTAACPRGPYHTVTFNAPILSRTGPGPRWLHVPEGAAILDRFLGELPGVLGGPEAEALLHVELPWDGRPLLERLPSGTADLRALSMGVYVESDRSFGLLWLARARRHAWAAEQRFLLTPDAPRIERRTVEEEVAGLERRLAGGR